MDSVIHGANWYVQEINQRKRLEAVALPNLRRAMERMVFGGGFFAFGLPTEIEELSFEFSLYGSHADIRSRFGREAGDWTTFTYYERMRDIAKGVNKGRVVMIKGLVNEITHPRVLGKRADTTRYGGGSVWVYHDVVDGKTVHKFDVQNNILIINGVDYTGEHNRIIAA